MQFFSDVVNNPIYLIVFGSGGIIGLILFIINFFIKRSKDKLIEKILVK